MTSWPAPVRNLRENRSIRSKSSCRFWAAPRTLPPKHPNVRPCVLARVVEGAARAARERGTGAERKRYCVSACRALTEFGAFGAVHDVPLCALHADTFGGWGFSTVFTQASVLAVIAALTSGA